LPDLLVEQVADVTFFRLIDLGSRYWSLSSHSHRSQICCVSSSRCPRCFALAHCLSRTALLPCSPISKSSVAPMTAKSEFGLSRQLHNLLSHSSLFTFLSFPRLSGSFPSNVLRYSDTPSSTSLYHCCFQFLFNTIPLNFCHFRIRSLVSSSRVVSQVYSTIPIVSQL